MKIIGAIIAGGHSSRMGGREKAFLELAAKPVILHVIEQFEPQVDQLVINANGDANRFSEFGLDVVPDVLTSLTTMLVRVRSTPPAFMSLPNRNFSRWSWLATTTFNK